MVMFIHTIIVENVDSRIHTTTFLRLHGIYCNNEGSKSIDSGYGYKSSH